MQVNEELKDMNNAFKAISKSREPWNKHYPLIQFGYTVSTLLVFIFITSGASLQTYAIPLFFLLPVLYSYYLRYTKIETLEGVVLLALVNDSIDRIDYEKKTQYMRRRYAVVTEYHYILSFYLANDTRIELEYDKSDALKIFGYVCNYKPHVKTIKYNT